MGRARWLTAVLAAALLILSACDKPKPATTGAATPTPPTPARVAPQPEAKAEPTPTTLELAEVGLKVTPIKDWHTREAAAGTKLLPDDPQPVMLESPSTPGALLLLSRLAPSTLGEADPQKAPAAVLAGVRKNLGSGPAAPTVSDATAPSISGLNAVTALKAVGAFPELGLAKATATFVSGTGADKAVYLLAAFAPSDAAQKDLDAMLASVAPLVRQAEAAPTTSAAPGKSAAPTPAPAGKAPATKAPGA